MGGGPPLVLHESRAVGEPLLDRFRLSVDSSNVCFGSFGRHREHPTPHFGHPAHEHTRVADLVVGSLRIDHRRHRSRIAERRRGIADSEIVDRGVGFLQMKIAGVVSVEVGLDIYLTVAEAGIPADNTDKQSSAGGRSAEVPHLGRIAVNRYQIRSESRRRLRTVPIEIASHPYASSYTAGKRCILAQKHEIGHFRILRVAELIVIEHLYQAAHGVAHFG